MHVHTDGPLLAYTLPPGINPLRRCPPMVGVSWSAPYAVLEHHDDDHTREQGGLLRMIQRIHTGETLWLQEWPDHIKAGPWGSLMDMVTAGQTLVLRPLCDLYDASPDEVMRVVDDAGDDGLETVMPPSMSVECANAVGGMRPAERERVGWRFRAKVAAWALNDARITTHPISHALGYRDSVMRRMEPAGTPWTPESAPQAIDAVKRVEAFVRHVDVAAKVALDTPQPVTLDLSMGKVVFENVRVSPSIRGLRITLPTGGWRFYREAKLTTGGKITMGDGTRPLATKRIPMDIFYQLGLDMYIWTKWCSRHGFNVGRHDLTRHLDTWLRLVGISRQIP